MRVTFLVGGFPAPSITFILDQITGLIDRGIDVDIVAYEAGPDDKVHPDVEAYELPRRTEYVGLPRNLLWRFIKAKLLLLAHLRQLPAMLRTLNFVRYGKEAATLRLLYTASALLRRGDHDLLHCQFGPNGAIGAALIDAGVISAPLVTTFHGHGIRVGLERGPGVYDLLRKRSARVLSISGFNRRHLLQFGFTPEQLTDLPVGIKLALFPNRWQADEGMPSSGEGMPLPGKGIPASGEPIRILSVGTLIEFKGHAFGIRSIDHLRRRHPSWNLHYTILGGGELEERLRALIHELDLGDRVELAGPGDRNDVIAALHRSHLFLMPSLAEATPVVLMEAQAVGLPVVATRVGGIDEVVMEGESGYLVPPEDAGALADALERLILAPESWPAMGQRGRQHIEAVHDIDRLNDRLATLYAELAQVGGD